MQTPSLSAMDERERRKLLCLFFYSFCLQVTLCRLCHRASLSSVGCLDTPASSSSSLSARAGTEHHREGEKLNKRKTSSSYTSSFNRRKKRRLEDEERQREQQLAHLSWGTVPPQPPPPSFPLPLSNRSTFSQAKTFSSSASPPPPPPTGAPSRPEGRQREGARLANHSVVTAEPNPTLHSTTQQHHRQGRYFTSTIPSTPTPSTSTISTHTAGTGSKRRRRGKVQSLEDMARLSLGLPVQPRGRDLAASRSTPRHPHNKPTKNQPLIQPAPLFTDRHQTFQKSSLSPSPPAFTAAASQAQRHTIAPTAMPTDTTNHTPSTASTKASIDVSSCEPTSFASLPSISGGGSARAAVSQGNGHVPQASSPSYLSRASRPRTTLMPASNTNNSSSGGEDGSLVLPRPPPPPPQQQPRTAATYEGGTSHREGQGTRSVGPPPHIHGGREGNLYAASKTEEKDTKRAQPSDSEVSGCVCEGEGGRQATEDLSLKKNLNAPLNDDLSVSTDLSCSAVGSFGRHTERELTVQGRGVAAKKNLLTTMPRGGGRGAGMEETREKKVESSVKPAGEEESKKETPVPPPRTEQEQPEGANRRAPSMYDLLCHFTGQGGVDETDVF